MIAADLFLNSCYKFGIRFFTGVPDSLLQDFCTCLDTCCLPLTHVVAANEGGAVALATGHYLATQSPALVYMQNSGQGNAANPLLSLADPEIYGIPMLMLVGWRGEPGGKDEPQHVKQGRVTRALFETMEIPVEVLTTIPEGIEGQLQRLIEKASEESRPVALMVRKGTFERFRPTKVVESSYPLVRERVIEEVLKILPEETVFVSSTGHISRELYEIRVRQGKAIDHDFLTVGSMGHASQIALGIVLSSRYRRVCCLDGDGAVLMHMGAMALVGQAPCPNYIHIVLNNGAHGSVGGQATIGFKVSLTTIAQGCGYKHVFKIETLAELKEVLCHLEKTDGPVFLEVRLGSAVRANLGRPQSGPADNKRAFMAVLAGGY